MGVVRGWGNDKECMGHDDRGEAWPQTVGDDKDCDVPFGTLCGGAEGIIVCIEESIGA